MADGRQRSELRIMTARVMSRAVAFDEINSNQLKARMKADGQHRSELRIMTARVMSRAVANKEISSNQLTIKI